MLGGLDENALTHEGGSVAHASDVAPGCGNLEVVQIRSAKDDAGACRSGDESHGNCCTRVQTNALKVQGGLNRLLELGRIGQADAHSRLSIWRLYLNNRHMSVANLPHSPNRIEAFLN